MNEQRIHELLQKYFDGASSLAEEQDLRRFFSGREIPDSLKIYQPVFAFFEEEKSIGPPPTGKTVMNANNITLAIIAGIAASIAIFFIVRLPETEAYIYYVDGERVYDKAAVIESAGNRLQLLAESMQKAKDGMSALERVQEGNRSLQQFNKLQSAYRHIEKIVSGNENEAGIQ
jgi:hypothetical protein